jgi:hypothetical protein
MTHPGFLPAARLRSTYPRFSGHCQWRSSKSSSRRTGVCLFLVSCSPTARWASDVGRLLHCDGVPLHQKRRKKKKKNMLGPPGGCRRPRLADCEAMARMVKMIAPRIQLHNGKLESRHHARFKRISVALRHLALLCIRLPVQNRSNNRSTMKQETLPACPRPPSNRSGEPHTRTDTASLPR